MAGRDGGKTIEAGVVARVIAGVRFASPAARRTSTSSGPGSRWHPSPRRPPRAAVRLPVRGQHVDAAARRRSRSTSRRCARSRRLRPGPPRHRDAEGPDGEAPLADPAARRRAARRDGEGDRGLPPDAGRRARLPHLAPHPARGPPRHRRADGLRAPDEGRAPFAFEIIDGATIKRILNPTAGRRSRRSRRISRSSRACPPSTITATSCSTSRGTRGRIASTATARSSRSS
jgi:hypothetical protein